MDDDLISNDFTGNINTQIIKRNLKILLLILILFSVYAVLDFAEWYPAISKANSLPQTTLNFYNYKIRPVIALLFYLSISVFGFFI
jgi:hypothetical protein